MKTSNTYQKHLDLSKRIQIEGYLNANKSFIEIADLINKSYPTVYYEIKNRRSFVKGNLFNTSKGYDPNCAQNNRTPFVCNGCASRKGCRKHKFFYIAEDAHREYRENLSIKRSGINMNPLEFSDLKEIVRKYTDQGHSFYMIKNYNQIKVSVKTLYNYQDQGYFEIPNIDLPRKIRYKPRKKRQDIISRNRKHREGRTYQDFLLFKEKFLKENEYEVEVVLMDTVEGTKGTDESVLLTLLFTTSNFLMAFKMDHKTVECVNKVFDYLKKALGHYLFYELFQVILTDNGVEFSDPESIESNDYLKTKVFYCDPNRSDQKGKIEVAHEYIRRFIPKGNSFNKYSGDEITLMINHINSVCRDLFKGLSPFQLQGLFGSEHLFEILGYKMIDYKDIILSNKIFKKDTK